MLSKAFSALLVTALAVSASPLEARQACTQTYTVVSGDTCAVIESKTGISDSQLHAQNPSINSACTNLKIGQVLCLGGGSTGGGSSGGCPETSSQLVVYWGLGQNSYGAQPEHANDPANWQKTISNYCQVPAPNIHQTCN
ncbi:hypothetical protein GGX14DRAFT_588640 [Mycena pura]|uniref:LysM domain-containing protein n=1 Tax=Mycena pura TaxID=153505 RepID=A0AAD6UZ04_9AGAR|nr:hypothetical protein GGX14DRAFT_588640 [Mycena pura]